LFDRLGRHVATPQDSDGVDRGPSSEPPSSTDAPDQPSRHPSSDIDAAVERYPATVEQDVVPSPSDLPTVPLPVVPSSASPLCTEPIEPRYDPAQPNQRPIAGIDLPTFAVLRRQLAETAAPEQRMLLVAHGLTPETWQAVSTAWVARLGQMPFLHAIYSAADRKA
jgi:hypothetical protein